MKTVAILTTGLFFAGASTCFAQLSDTLNDKQLKDRVLSEIQINFDKKTRTIDSTVFRLDEKVGDLDKSIKESKDAKEKADKLLLRVQALEDKQKAIDQNEMNIFQANYQSALVNLVSMDREIKPLILFNSTKAFFGSLGEASNPLNYPGFQDWYKSFNTYLQSNKDKSPMLSVTSSLLSISNSLTSAVPLTGPITSALFSSMTSYIDNIPKKQKDLKDQSEQMMALTMKLSQFNYDKDQIEHEWENITKELNDLQSKYDKSISNNLKTLNISTTDFSANFTKENDAEKRYLYLTELRKKAAEFVSKEKNENQKEWKQQVFIPMNEVQGLKLRFGQITFRISQNIVKYSELFAKYREDKQIGSRIKDLEVRLKELQETFDKAFDPLDYINSANKMYKVN
ncbi:hypothetical protein SAMN05421788_101512 [Filimonas lacunae]|uniref:Uncharacterized protein n=1 Tax=Filimonas lacunae TaxID=477680 RepID=A0A173MN33_9BACT|nr:hypothetical protein [Filimonas lacunae]BAV09065.1 hypothetical protein FLA_5112 [Filimonas lacunae]SIS66728.1 hypothetical protein SAMN05421788_101512 [Filimonas lacunae]